MLSGGDARMKKTQFTLKAQKHLLSFYYILGGKTLIFPLKSFKTSEIVWIILIQIVVNFEGGKQRVLESCRRGHSTQPVRRGTRSSC